MNHEFFGDDYESYKGESAYRKVYASAKRFYDSGVFMSDAEDSYLAAIKEERDELVKERKRLSDQRREYNKLLAHDARAEHLSEELIRVANELAEDKPLQFDRSLYPVNSKKEALLLFSDWHYGMITDNIWNHYDTDTCRRRVEETVNYTKKYLTEQNITKLHIVMLGDAAHGAIHVGCRVQSEEDTCDQLMHVSEILAE